MKNALYTLLGVIAGFILAGVLFFISRVPSGEPIVLQPAPTSAPIAVHVVGGVARPGIYYLPESARVQDAIDAAGGLLTTAITSNLNLAMRLQDGQRVAVSCKDDSCPVEEAPLELPGAEDTTTLDETASGDSGGVEIIDINLATLEELDALPGIGPSLAQRIIDYRDENGPFYVVEDLLNVSGIGASTLDNIRDQITTGY